MTPRIFEIIPSVIVVELQPAADRFTIFNDPARPYLSYFTGVDTHRAYLPDGNWQLIGRLSEVTEEQAAGLVYKHEWSDGYRMYKDYEDKLPKDFYHNRITAVESLHSAIKAAGLFMENPYGETIPMAFEEDCLERQLWRKAQQRTICPERTVLLRKVK